MSDFRLASIDWASVRLLHAEHLGHETGYVEELMRWALELAAGPGVIRAEPDSLSLVASSASTYRLTLRRFQALTPAGYWVCVGDDEYSPTLDLDRQRYLEAVVPISVGVDTRAKDSRAHQPTQSSALLECRSLWPKYALGAADSVDGCDCIKIAEVINSGGELVLNPDFIPDCLSIGSHPLLIRAVTQIRDLADEGLRILTKTPDTVRDIAGQLAAALAPGATLVDQRARPYAYMERIAGALRANRMIAAIRQHTGPGDDAVRAVDDALQYAENGDAQGLWLGPALQKMARALQELLKLYANLQAEVLPAAPEPQPIDPRMIPSRVVGRPELRTDSPDRPGPTLEPPASQNFPPPQPAPQPQTLPPVQPSQPQPGRSPFGRSLRR
jgi:hypothetical protein